MPWTATTSLGPSPKVSTGSVSPAPSEGRSVRSRSAGWHGRAHRETPWVAWGGSIHGRWRGTAPEGFLRRAVEQSMG
jgi:hypothetical protein